MQQQIQKTILNAFGWILGPLSLIHIGAYGRILFENLTQTDFIVALASITVALMISILFRNRSIQLLTVAAVLSGILGYIAYLRLPDNIQVEMYPVSIIGTVATANGIWVIFGLLSLSLIITSALIQVLSREVLVLKTPFKAKDDRKYVLGKKWESDTILSLILGFGIYIALQSTLPTKINSIFIIQSICAALILLNLGMTGIGVLLFEEKSYISDIERKKDASSNRTLSKSEIFFKYIIFLLSWLIFTAVVAGTGFFYFQFLKQESLITRLIGFNANLMIGAVIIMILSMNEILNGLIRKFGLIGGILGLLLLYQKIANSIQIPLYDIMLGLLLFAGIWSFFNTYWTHIGPENAGFWIGITLIIMGYTLLIPSKQEELASILETVQLVVFTLAVLEIIVMIMRKRHVPTIFQIDDRINNSPKTTREVEKI